MISEERMKEAEGKLTILREQVVGLEAENRRSRAMVKQLAAVLAETLNWVDSIDSGECLVGSFHAEADASELIQLMIESGLIDDPEGGENATD